MQLEKNEQNIMDNYLDSPLKAFDFDQFDNLIKKLNYAGIMEITCIYRPLKK